MKRLGILALVVAALAMTLVLATPKNVAACTCGGLFQTPIDSAKSPNSCAEAQSKLYNKLTLSLCTDRCYENLVITTDCYYDFGDLRYHISGYLQYRCAINCDPFP